MITPEQRKAHTEARLQKLGIPTNPYLPMIENETEARIREPVDVARRAVILYALAAIAHGIDKEWMVTWLHDEYLWGEVSPKESDFLLNAQPAQQELTNAHWRLEALWTLLWALGKVSQLVVPTAECDVEQLRAILPRLGASTQEFIQNAQLRSLSEILDAADEIYRIHWAVRNAGLNGQAPPANLNQDVVTERHYALNWLTWYADKWDDVTTDT